MADAVTVSSPYSSAIFKYASFKYRSAVSYYPESLYAPAAIALAIEKLMLLSPSVALRPSIALSKIGMASSYSCRSFMTVPRFMRALMVEGWFWP